MAFPTTPVLDNFNAGAATALTARAGWGAVVLSTGSVGYQTDATPTFAAPVSANIASNYWNSSSTDCECYLTITSWGAGLDTFTLPARITATGSVTCYGVVSGSASATDFRIAKFIAGVRTFLTAGVATTVISGDSIGISVIGSQVTSYYKSGAGAWAQVETVSDASVTGSGFLGGTWRSAGNATHQIDDFGGGAPVAAALRPIQRVVRLPRAGA